MGCFTSLRRRDQLEVQNWVYSPCILHLARNPALSLHKVFHPSPQFDAHDDDGNDDVSSSILITSTHIA